MNFEPAVGAVIVEKFRECDNPRPWRKDERILRHGLVRCQTCSRMWNRDVNSSRNIHKIVSNKIKGFKRPKYLRRGEAVISGARTVKIRRSSNFTTQSEPQT